MKQTKNQLSFTNTALIKRAGATSKCSHQALSPKSFLARGDSFLKRLCGVLLLVVLCSGLSFGADKQIIQPPGTKPGGNYSPGILVEGTLYISGQAGEDASGKVPADFEAEVKQALDNIGVVLKAAGMSPTNVVSVQVYLTDGALFPKMNAVYTKYFTDPRPTRTTVVVAKLVGTGRIEITATARK